MSISMARKQICAKICIKYSIFIIFVEYVVILGLYLVLDYSGEGKKIA